MLHLCKQFKDRNLFTAKILTIGQQTKFNYRFRVVICHVATNAHITVHLQLAHCDVKTGLMHFVFDITCAAFALIVQYLC